MTETFVPKEPGWYWWMETGRPMWQIIHFHWDDRLKKLWTSSGPYVAGSIDFYLERGTFAPGPLTPPDMEKDDE